jgi:hypothetical protein
MCLAACAAEQLTRQKPRDRTPKGSALVLKAFQATLKDGCKEVWACPNCTGGGLARLSTSLFVPP